MNKQDLKRIHALVCKGRMVSPEIAEEYAQYVEEISPPLSDFKPVGAAANAPLDSGLLNELGKPAGVSYHKIANWWGPKA